MLCVASSGIASLLLPGGRTSHSMFKIPLNANETSVCAIRKQDMRAALLRETSLIIWDEVPMQNRFDPETVDRTLRDIRGSEKPFGGLTVVFGGDFRQILPVIPKGTRSAIVAACLKHSQIWKSVQELKLKTNTRLEQGKENLDYAKWLLKIGEGQDSPDSKVKFPESMRCSPNTAQGLIAALYPNIQVPGITGDQYFLERTILAPRNDDVHSLNSEVLDCLPGERKTYRSADRAELEGEEENNVYTQEFLHELNASGLPLHNLVLKEGAPIMVL